MTKLCRSCWREFTPIKHYYPLCLDCYKKTRSEVTTPATGIAAAYDLRAMRIRKLESELAELEAMLSETTEYYSDLVQEAAIPAPVLRQLIQLAHPDRHGSSKASTEATQWLLDYRRKYRDHVKTQAS